MDELETIQGASFTSSLIFHIPHAREDIPEWVREQFLLFDEELEKELLTMTDRYTDDLFTTKDHPYIASPVSRLVLDVERFTDDEKEPMANKGMGAIYTSTHDGKKLRRELAPHETKELLRKYHQRNEESVTSSIKYALLANDVALVVDCHSFPSSPLPFEEGQSLPRVDICIGTDAFHTPSGLEQLVTSYFEKLGYSVRLNKPYEGTYVPILYYNRNKKVQSIMIELNRSLYMDEATGEKRATFDELHQQIIGLVEQMRRYLIEARTGI